MGLGLTGIGAAALAGFGVAVGAAAEFERQIDHFGAVSGATQDELKEISNLALEMGRTTVYNANEAAGAMVELGKAGFTTKEILAGIGPAVASLAAAGDLPLTQATEILANTLRTFNLEAKDAVYVADQLAGAANASTIEVDDLAVSLRYAGGVASSLGIPLHEVADALAILGNNGIRGSTAGTTLRRILLELNPATKKQTEALRELGIIQGGANLSAEDLAKSQEKLSEANDKVAKAQQRVNDLQADYAASGAPKTALEATNRAQALRDATDGLADAQEMAQRASEAHNLSLEDQTNLFFDAQGKAKSLGEIFQIVEDKTKHLNAAEKQRVLDIIFGSRAIAGALILAREGAQGFDEISKQIEKVSAAEVAEKRLDNLSGALRRLKNVLVTEMIGAGTPLQGILQGIVETVTRLIQAFGGLPEPIQQAALVGLMIFGVLATLGGGILLLVSFIARGVRAFAELRAVMIGTNVAKKALDANVPILAGRFGILTKALHLVLSPFKLLWGLMVSVVTAIAAFLGVSVGVVVAVIAIIAILIILIVKVKAVREFFISVGEAIVGFFTRIPGYLETAQHAVGGFFAMLVDKGAEVLNAIGGFFSRLPGIVGGALSTALSGVANFVGGVLNFFMGLPGLIIGFLGQILAAVGNFLTELPFKLAYATGYMIGLWIRMWYTFFSKVTEFTAMIVGLIIGFFVLLFNTAVEWGPKIFSAVVDFFEKLPGRVIGFLDATWDGFYAWAGRMLTTALEVGGNVLQAITDFFIQLPGRVAEYGSQAYTAFVQFADRTWDRAWQLGSDVLAAIVEWFSQLPGRIADFLSSALTNLQNWATDAWNAAVRMATDVYNAIRDGISDIPGLVEGVLDRAIQAFLGVIGRAYNAAKRLASNLWNGFKDGLFGSPHTKIEYAMWDMVANVEKSIQDLKNQVGRIQSLGTDISNPMSVNFNSPAAMEALRQQASMLATQAQGVAQGAQTTFNNEFHTDADPQQISSEIMWQQLVRVR